MPLYKAEKVANKKTVEETREELGTKGADGARQHEAVPNFNRTPRETVFCNKNTWIVLGGDRNASPKSGYAGQGATQSAAIDTVVGRGTNTDGEPKDKDKNLDSNFFTDAGRVYLTEKGDVDNYFGIAQGIFGDFMSSKKKSAAVMKADHVRLFAREGIKLVTGKGKNAQGTAEKNSLGKEAAKVPPIEFIAGNYTDQVSDPPILQPLVKGDNLVEYLMGLHAYLERVHGFVSGLTIDMMAVNATLAGLTAPIPPLSATHVNIGVKNFNNIQTLISEGQNLTSLQINHLEPVGQTYINSNHVYTT